MLYRLLRPLLFRGDPEKVHEQVLGLLERLDRHPRLEAFVRNRYIVDDPKLASEVMGLHFPNPVGVAAGFDKDARLPRVLPCLGFGFVEVGTVTREPQAGNPRPRIWRYPDAKALVNRMGFPNEGADAVSTRLAQEGRPSVPLGVNIGKSRSTPLEEAEKDYLHTLERFHPLADYVAVNVSSPNTPGLRSLQDRDHLDRLLGALQTANERLARDADVDPRPLLLKLAPDLGLEALEEAVDVALDHQVDALIATNTTTARDTLPDAEAEGGLSGAPLRDRATEVTAFLHERTDGRVPLVGVGGIMDGDDALERIEAGASLLQVYTGFIYGGPGTAARINQDLSRAMAAEDVDHLDELVGRRSRELAP